MMNLDLTEINENLQKIDLKLGDLARVKYEAEQGFYSVNAYSYLAESEERDCKLHGTYNAFISRYKNGDDISMETKCPKCVQEKIDQLKVRKGSLLIKRLRAEGVIAKRFENATFDSYKPVNNQAEMAWDLCQGYVENWENVKANGVNLMLLGKYGTGKTHLAIAMLKTLTKRYLANVKYTTVFDLDAEIKSSWNTSTNERIVLRSFIQPDLLIIDEVGVQYGSNAEKTNLFKVIGKRYDQMKPTVLISNLTIEELGDFTGERVLSRMQENGGVVIPFQWEDFRKVGNRG